MSFWDIFRKPSNSKPQTPAMTSWAAATASGDSSTQQEDGAQVEVYDMQGKRLDLGEREYKTSGGEGAVYSFPSNPRILVKIYKGKTLEKNDKMKEIQARIMDMAGNSRMTSQTNMAWPLMPVFNANRNIIGFAMRKCEGNSLLALRGPSSIRRFFPGWNRRNLVETALDFVQKVKLLANQGIFINDFNPANFLVDAKGRVSFIDCDSYQVPAARGGVHVSRTYFPSYSAPELLKNNSLLGQQRNIHQVEFGTAMIVFHIIMCGLHPYSYYDPKHKSECSSPDENLLKGRCPIGLGSGCIMPPGIWYNLWSHLTCSMKNAFIMTFRDGHADPGSRASLDRLEAELIKMLHVMSQDPARENLMPQVAKPYNADYASSSKTGNGQPFRPYPAKNSSGKNDYRSRNWRKNAGNNTYTP